MVMNLSPPFVLSSIFPPNSRASLPPDLLQHNYSVCPFSSNLNLLNSKFDNSSAFTTQLHSKFACQESSGDAPRSEGSSGLSSTSASTLLEEKSNSKDGQEGRRKLGGTRGGRERGINKSGHTMYKGVRKRKGGRWVSEIREPGKKSRIWLGTFATPEMAATAYDTAAFNLKTPCAYLNFPQHVSSLPILSSRSPKHIQEAAAKAAALRGVSGSTPIRNSGGLVATPTPHVHETSKSLFTEQQQELPQCISVETRAYSLIEEEMMLDMPNVLADMANGLMITPPLHYYLATPTNADNTSAWDCNAESSLWNL